MIGSKLFKSTEDFLKAEGFNKKGSCWNRSNGIIISVVCFQKGKGASKTEFDLTINIGIYVAGTQKLLFDEEPEAIVDAYCLLRRRPSFLGLDSDWLSFNSSTNTGLVANQIDNLVKNAISFLNTVNTVEKVVSYLPIDLWKSNTNFHGELIKMACAYLIDGEKNDADDLLKIIILGKSAWTKRAEKVLHILET